MKSILIKIGLVVGLMSSSSALLAADGSSGCGPGWYILKKNSLVSSFLRAVTNGFLSPTQTIGMTLGTSNCSKHSIVLRDKEVERFVAYNYTSFQHNVARGEGDYLEAVAHMYNCDFIGAQRLQQNVQNSFDYLYGGGSDAHDVTARLNDVVHYDATTKTHCSVI